MMRTTSEGPGGFQENGGKGLCGRSAGRGAIAAFGRQGDAHDVTEWMDQWLETYARPVIKLSTYTSYETYIRGHVKPEIGSLYINRLTTLDLQKFLTSGPRRGT